MMDIPAGWTPGEFKPSIDPMLETTIDDIKNDDRTREKFIDLIVEKLKTVYDPEISIDIYNLGLIYDIRVTEAQYVFVLMSLTSAWCPAADTIPVDVQQKIESIPGLKCKVKITMVPQWDQDKINPDHRGLLGL